MKKTILTAVLVLSAGLLAAPLSWAQSAPKTGNPAISLGFDSVKASNPKEARQLSAIGGTFPAALYANLFKAYSGKIGVTVAYDAAGSSAGINSLTGSTYDFAASDAPLSDAQMSVPAMNDVLHVPTAFGGIVMAYNVPGLTKPLRLTGDNIALIYEGEIRFWDDDRLVGDNPELSGKHQGIITVHRAEGSGTTFGFTSFLSGVNSDWKGKSGTGAAINWPVGLAVPGNDGVASVLGKNPYSIGYVDLNFAIGAKVSYASVKNKAGNFVEPTLQSVSAAAAEAAPSGTDLRLNVMNASGRDTYPIVTGTYVLVHKNMKDFAKALATTRLLWWMTHEGQAANESLLYARVPPAITAKTEQVLMSITVVGDKRPLLAN